MAEPDLAARLQRRFPELAVEPLRLLDVGFGSTVVETADGIVFRVARHPRAAAGHARELDLLPQLAGRLTAAVPRPLWRIEPGPDFPHGAIGYRKLPGEPAAADGGTSELVEDVARFLRSLHGLRDVAAARRGLELDALRAATTPALERRLAPAELERLARWWDEVRADDDLRSFEPALRHGDFWYENLLVEDGRLVGVLDWGGAAYADPAEDFSTLRHFGDAFAEAVFDAYGAGERLRRRERRHWEMRELYGIGMAVELDDCEELAEGVAKLRRGAIFTSWRSERA
jgi:aminoglycoside phosphotransferase (APT) family kinase protein